MVSSVRPPVALFTVLLAVLMLPSSASAKACSSYPTQAAAQSAADTRDGDGDGIYCESLPCPCATGGGSAPAPTPAAAPSSSSGSCLRPKGTVPLGFSSTKYPTIRAHYERALRRGWPRILVINRAGADARRNRLLDEYGLGTMPGQDRDEYPPAIGRGAGRKALMRGTNPRGWNASVAYVPSSENRSHGSTMGIKLRRFCDGTRFKYVFY